MCGICGFMAKREDNRLTTVGGIADMFSATDMRGRDAAGFAASVSGKLFRIRQDNSSTKLLGKVTTLLVDESKAWIGHCRLATQGTERDMENNHPFMQDGLALIHNGIIFNYDEYLDRRIGHVKTVGNCDSELILQSINYHRHRKKSITQSVQHMARELDGDMACALISRQGQLWLWRREEDVRQWASTPLTLAIHPQDQGVHFASTLTCLEKSMANRQDWDFSKLSANAGIHLWLQRGEIKTSTFTMPDCENPTVSYGRCYWPSYEGEMGASSPYVGKYNSSGVTTFKTCEYCGEKLVNMSSHVCEYGEDGLLNETSPPFCLVRTNESTTYVVAYPQYEKNKEDVLYTCEKEGCGEVLLQGEVMHHRQSIGHYQYREETGI